MAIKIGCSNLVYAIMTTEDTKEAAPVYETVVNAPGVMHVNINPNSSLATAFYDDGPGETAATVGNLEVEIQKNFLSSQNKADLLGHKLDANGGVVYDSKDVPPWVAIGFKTLKSNNTYRYVWLFKGKFTEPNDDSETKGDSISFQADTIMGQFVRLSTDISLGAGDPVNPWKYEIDAEHPTANPVTIAAWFEAPKLPTSTIDA